MWLFARSRALAIGVVICILIGFVALVDGIATSGKIYQGVSVGSIDVSNMTVEEARSAIEGAYQERLDTTEVYIFANDEALAETDVELVKTQQDALSEQLSVEQAQKDKVLWIENASTLDASLPAEKLATEAFEVGRNGALFDRIAAHLKGWTIKPYVAYNELSLEKLVSDIDKTIGDPVVQYGIAVEQGHASITEGHDGYMVNAQKLTQTLDESFLDTDDAIVKLVAHTEYVPMIIDAASAQKTADAVNTAIAEGASFAFEGQSAFADATELGSWIKTHEEKRGDAWYLKPYVDEGETIDFLINSMNMKGTDSQIAVDFTKDGDAILVKPTEQITIPNVGGALELLNTALFATFDQNGKIKAPENQFDIPISVQTTDSALSLEEAMAFGVVSKFSTFTTEFVGNNATENRTYNIHKAADLINDSIIEPDGGRWSFNETAGDCNAAAGFKDANVISGDEMVQEAGGGVCQVATTVFNAVYNAGLSIKERHNHTIVSASYPAGKDAAVVYPSLDFIWVNNTPSEILLTTSYTANSITVDLIGVDPGRTVKTDTGQWQEGETFKIKYEIDDTLKPNQSYKKTEGFDGSSITVVRTVTDENGEVVEQNTFYSVYSPMNEIIVVGPESDMEQIKAKYEKDDEDTKDSDS